MSKRRQRLKMLGDIVRGGAGSANCSASEALTPEQIKNWRNVLIGMVGPYANMMPDADVQKLRDKISSDGL